MNTHWRLEILHYLEQQIRSLVVPCMNPPNPDDPASVEQFENDLKPDWNRLRVTDSGIKHQDDEVEINHRYLAPRVPNKPWKTACRYFFPRPITPRDLTGLDKENLVPAIYLQIIGGQQRLGQDTPDTRSANPPSGRPSHQKEYFQFMVHGVFRDMTYDPATKNPKDRKYSWLGNGPAWYKAKCRGGDVQDLSHLIDNYAYLSGLSYWKSVNEQVLDFIDDIQTLISLTHIDTINARINQDQVTIHNTYWGDWGMIPGRENSPMETVGIPLIIEVDYPKMGTAYNY